MYLVRRVYKCQPRTARAAAKILAKVGQGYEEAGQRSPVRVYLSGGTVPGPSDTLYMDWLAEKLESPYREDNVIPEEILVLGQQLREYVEETWIEFYEMYSPQW